MNKKNLLLSFSIVSLIGVGSMAYGAKFMKWPFYAPSVNTTADVVSPDKGDIVFEDSTSKFKGYAGSLLSWVDLTSSSSAGAGGKKLGYDHTTGVNATAAAGDINAVRVFASANATLTRLGIFLAANATGKKYVLGIYSQNASGLPDTLLGQTNEQTTVAQANASVDGGYKVFDLQSSVNITSGTAYWLVVQSNSSFSFDNAFNDSSVGGQKYKSTTYSSTLPSSFGSLTGNAGAGVSMGGF